MSKYGPGRRTLEFSPERLALVLLGILGVAVTIQSARLSLGNLHAPGPGFMPFLLGASMILLSILSYLEIPPAAGGKKETPWRAEKPILLIFGGLLLYLALLDLLGFYVTTFSLLVYLMRSCGEKQYRRCLWVSGVTVAVVYVVFFKLFIIPFPEGLWGL